MNTEGNGYTFAFSTIMVVIVATRGKWIYGFLIGFFTMTIRIFNPAYPEGAMLAILLMNAVAPTIDYYVVNANVTKRKKRMTNNLKTT